MKTSNRLTRIITQENFSALNNFFAKPIILLLLSVSIHAFAQDWYVSNSAGMILEKTFSRAALRNPYALKIETHSSNQIPTDVIEYIDSSISVPQTFNTELHTLYENGEEKTQRWILKYANENPWVVISVNGNDNNDLASNGFAEYYDESGLLIQEDTFLAESILSIQYSYNDGKLLRTETLQDGGIPLYSDEYRYARSGSLRSIMRIFHSEELENRISYFAPLGLTQGNNFAAKPIHAISSDFISDIINAENRNIEYVTDERGRIISEIHKDEEGNIIGELTNTWSGERLATIAWNGENDVRFIEYEYNENGDRIIERNYRTGILERLIRTEEGLDVEELYLRGSLSLRAVWKDGQKISEEYFHPNPRRNR